MIKPAFRFVGGKTKLAPTILHYLPTKIHTYYEPFLGGGAVYLALYSDNRFDKDSKIILTDINTELIHAHIVIRDYPEKLFDELLKHEFNKEYYLKLRNHSPIGESDLFRASRYVYLTKASFNGLYRENSKGEPNAAYGFSEKYPPPKVPFKKERFMEVSEALQNATIYPDRYENVIDNDFIADDGVVYIDSPYIPLSVTSSFTGYNKDGFGLDQHKNLASKIDDLASKGIRYVASNSDTPLTRELYKNHRLIEVQVGRNIAGDGSKRGKVGELLITNAR